jgi:hypothetical protein
MGFNRHVGAPNSSAPLSSGESPSVRILKFGLLEYLSKSGRRNKWNTLGHTTKRGDLEHFLGLTFQAAERALADRAWSELQRSDLIRSDYSDTMSPGDWVELTARGKEALERHALDDLDEALAGVNPRFVALRDTAWGALSASDPESGRQAAGQMAELIDQLLHALAPDDQVSRAPWYVPAADAKRGISRIQRAMAVMEARHGRHDIARSHAVVAAQDSLQKLKHMRRTPPQPEVESALAFGEGALRELLIWPSQ